LTFPEKVFTLKEVEAAKNLIDNGYKHNLKVMGSPEFTKKVKQALDLIKTAGYYDYLQTYLRQIIEIDGLTQLRETEVAIWANKFAVNDPVDAASLFVQKAFTMKEYLEGEQYYGGNAEKRSTAKRIEFLETLENKTSDAKIKEECTRLLDMWKDSSVLY
jgi:hypothetical protein